jgi:hypothetical protein
VAGDIDAFDRHAPGTRLQHSEHHIDRGGLACAVGSEQAEDFAVLHLEGHVVHGVETSVALAQAGCFQRESRHGLAMLAEKPAVVPAAALLYLNP